MNFSYVGGSARQRSWFEEAARAITFPLDSVDIDVTVEWGEPPCPGHSEFACTTGGGSAYTITIRDTLDSQNSMEAPVQQFYQETVAHEIGHVVMFSKLADPSSACADFYKQVTGSGKVFGTSADLNPAGPWEDKIQEAMAETFKDAFLPDSIRVYDNRTNWQLDQAHYTTFMQAILPPADPGSSGVTGAHLNVGMTLLSEDATGAHIPPDIASGLGEFLDRPYPDGEEWTTTYHFQFDNYVLPEGATNITAQLQFRGVADHFPTRIEGSDTAPATYTFDSVLDGDFADTEIATGVYGVGSLSLHGTGMTVGPSYILSGQEEMPFVFVGSVPVPTPAGLTDWLFWTAKVGVDSPWPWTQYILATAGAAAPVVVLTYDIPAVPPTPATDPPPWPYTDPQLDAGEGDWGSVRFRSYG